MSTPATSNSVVQDLLAAPKVHAAFRLFESQAQQITEEQIEICAIAAPPFGEQLRAEYLRRKLSESGLVGTEIDEAGNCLALYEGRNSAAVLVISAHLDTVFPAATDLDRKSTRLNSSHVVTSRMPSSA